VPEWTDYDNEIKRVMEEWKSEKQSGGDTGIPVTTTPGSGVVHEDL